MKIKSFTIVLVLFTILVSCKNGEKPDSLENSVEKPSVKENFSVELDVIAEKADDFTVYYSEDNTNVFDGSRATWCGVKGGSVDEKVVIDLKPEIVPTNIRLDFGIKPERKDVVLKNIKIDYFGNSFEIKGSDFFNYFVVNPQFPYKVDAANGTVTFLKTPEIKQGTYFYPRLELLNKIKKITIK